MPKTYYLYTCSTCGKEFKSTFKPQSPKAPTYCSTECYHKSTIKSTRELFTCKYCGKPFERIVCPSSYKDGRTFQFCSSVCRNKARTQERIPCPRCGEMFFPLSRGKGNPRRKYCSFECANLKITDEIRCAIKETYPEHGPEPLMKRFGLSRSSVQTVAYKLGIKLRPDVFRKRVHESAREYMKNNNPMHDSEVCAKVSNWWKTHPDERAYRDDRLIKAKSDFQKKNPTGLERKLWKILDSLGIEFEASAIIKPKFVVDIRIGNLIIQADGDYWHGHPRFEPLTERQRAQQRRDKAQDAYLKKCGYTVIRIWESDMSKDVIESVLKRHRLLST